MMRFTAAATAWLLLVTTAYGHPGGGIGVDARGRVYFTDTYKGIQLIDERGRTSVLGGEPVHWMALDESGKWADAAPPPECGRASPDGAVPAVLTNPNAPCAVDADGRVYFLKDEALYRRPAGGAPAALLVKGADMKAKIRLVTGLAVGPRGSVYVLGVDSSDRTTGTDYHAVFRIDPGGTIAAVAENFVPGNGEPLDEVRWAYCRGLAVDDTVYVAGTGSRAVYRIGADGKAGVVLKAEAPWSPTAVAVRGGEVYVLEYDHTPAGATGRRWEPRVRKVDKDGNVTLLAHIRREQN
jgi:hypothetical protein